MGPSVVVAAARNDVIGANGRLPWHLPADLSRFRDITMGHAIIMGRRTWESIGRALPGRASIVLTSDPAYAADGASVVDSPAAALAAAAGDPEPMVIGGGEIYALFLPVARRVYMTRIEAVVDGDAYFPGLPAEEWVLESSEPGPRNGGWDYRFEVWRRR